MSFGFSIGDIYQTASYVWTIYRSLGNGPSGAKTHFSQFMAEFNSVKATLEALRESEQYISEEERRLLGHFYQNTIKESEKFIKKHKRLAKKVSQETLGKASNGHVIAERLKTIFDQVTWPLERDIAKTLCRGLERCVQIANVITTRHLSQVTEETRRQNLEMLRAIKNMSMQIAFILRRCMPEYPTHTQGEGDLLDLEFLSQLGHRSLQDLFQDGLRTITENGENAEDGGISPLSSNSQPTLVRIQDISLKLDHLIMRSDGGIERRAPRRIQQASQDEALMTENTQAAMVAPVISFLNQIRPDIQDALDQAGFQNFTVPGRFAGSGSTECTEPTRVLNDEVDEWERFNTLVKFQLTRIERPTPLAKDLAAQYPVRVIFQENNLRRDLREPVDCKIKVYFNARTKDIESIEALEVGGALKITHKVHEATLGAVESSMIPYVKNSTVASNAKPKFRFQFQGSHRVKIQEGKTTKRWYISPIYQCQNDEDFIAFQNLLLSRTVKFCVNVVRIVLDGVNDHCWMETVRILDDPYASSRTILYFATTIHHTHQRSGFVEWPVDGFEEMRSSSLAYKVRLSEPAARRSSMGSIATVMSTESHQSTSSRPDPHRQPSILELVFHNRQDREAFQNALRS